MRKSLQLPIETFNMALTLYLDLDGVLADFDKRVEELSGRRPDAFRPPHAMWKHLSPPRCPTFFDSLEMMPDAHVLFEFAKPYKPVILTGLPIGNWAAPQKRAWCARMLGADVEVLCVMRRDKMQYARPNAVLVDDNSKTGEEWRAAGGLFVHHTSAATSIAQLKKLLPPMDGAAASAAVATAAASASASAAVAVASATAAAATSASAVVQTPKATVSVALTAASSESASSAASASSSSSSSSSASASASASAGNDAATSPLSKQMASISIASSAPTYASKVRAAKPS
jgi:hypothetical protein